MTVDASRSRRRRRIAVIGSAVLVLAVAGVGIAVSQRGGGQPGPPPPVASDVDVIGTVPVCGFPVLNKIADDGVGSSTRAALLREAVPDVRTVDGSRVRSFHVVDGRAYVLEFDHESTYTVTSYDVESGRAGSSVTVPLEWEPPSESFSTDDFQVDQDGSVYLLDTLEGRRNLVKVGPDGTVAWTTRIPTSEHTTGSVLDLFGLVRWEDLDGDDVVGVHEGDEFHLVTLAGQYRGRTGTFPGNILGQLPDGSVVTSGTRRTDTARHSSFLVTAPDGTVTTRLAATRPLEIPFGSSTQHWISGPTGAAPGPDGVGFLVARGGTGIEWLADDGVRLGIWLDARADPGEDVALAEGTPLRLVDGVYYFLAEGDGGLDLTAVTQDGMRQLLEAPVLYNAATGVDLAQLGLGAGLATDTVYGYFPAGTDPRVTASFDPTWSSAPYRLRYQVRGDPRVVEPVATEPAEIDIPADGGEVALDLPAARPGVYEVDAALVDAATGEPVSGTCVRYTVGAPGGPGDLAQLASGAGWGGAQPLRGVEIADAFAIGSHRWQLDFGAIVPDPEATPRADALRWDSLPGADSADSGGDPFAQLAEAARLARASDTVLVLQLASGGAAEHAALDAGTWEGWSRLIVGEIHRRVPELVHWQPWNEPNNGGINGREYAQRVSAPFARAVRATSDDLVIVGGNVLGIDPPWWSAAVAAGVCDSLDVVGIHPYTGHNRTWEEEGFTLDDGPLAELARALEPCGPVPVWDTESGWWSDGVANFWAQGSSVARKLLWYRTQGIAEWTYFFSEGGFGEFDNSWSLIQYGQYVKPGAAAFAATARLIDGRSVEVVETGIPYVHAMRLGPAEESSGVLDAAAEILAVWTDDLSTEVRLRAPGGAVSVPMADQYGATAELTVPADGAALAVTGAPVFLAAPAGTGLQLAATEPFGPDVLLDAPVRASSTHPDATTANVTSGTANVTAPWRSGSLAGGAMDQAPWVQVDLRRPTEINRVAVATPGIRCCTAGLRDYTVSVAAEDGSWVTVADQRDQFFDRVALFTFPTVRATAVRVDVPMTTARDVPVLSANYTGVVGGAHPRFMPLESTSEWIAAVSGISAWGPGAG